MSNYYCLFLRSPLVQAVSFVVLLVPALILSRRKTREGLYNISAVIYALFILLDCILFVKAHGKWWYFLEAVIASVAFIFLAYHLVRLVSRVLRITDDRDESSMVFLMVMYHPVILVLVWAGETVYSWLRG